MDSHLTEECLWAVGMASRLRLIQANFADDPPATRQGYLAEEIERGLKDVAPSKRKLYLDALAERFPAWEAARPVAIAGNAPAAPETPESLLERLLAAASELSPEAKLEFGRQLQQAGLAVPAPAAASGSLELPPEARKKLGLGPEQNLSPERAVKLLVGLAELTLALDQLVWTLWRQLAPRSNYRKEAEFAKLMGPYLGGDPEISTQQVAQPLERTRRLIAAFLGAVGRAGSTYAKKHVARFGPEVIEDWARMEKKWNESLEFAAWRKYREQCKEHASEPAIENEIQEAIVKAAENLILGRGAG